MKCHAFARWHTWAHAGFPLFPIGVILNEAVHLDKTAIIKDWADTNNNNNKPAFLSNEKVRTMKYTEFFFGMEAFVVFDLERVCSRKKRIKNVASFQSNYEKQQCFKPFISM